MADLQQKSLCRVFLDGASGYRAMKRWLRQAGRPFRLRQLHEGSRCRLGFFSAVNTIKELLSNDDAAVTING
jgi:hypothetical protein